MLLRGWTRRRRRRRRRSDDDDVVVVSSQSGIPRLDGEGERLPDRALSVQFVRRVRRPGLPRLRRHLLWDCGAERVRALHRRQDGSHEPGGERLCRRVFREESFGSLWGVLRRQHGPTREQHCRLRGCMPWGCPKRHLRGLLRRQFPGQEGRHAAGLRGCLQRGRCARRVWSLLWGKFECDDEEFDLGLSRCL
jgi:hypothetical protein